jgi:hypothetical protein
MIFNNKKYTALMINVMMYAAMSASIAGHFYLRKAYDNELYQYPVNA